MPANRIIEGTWEEVVQQAEHLAGKHVRLVVIENGHAELPTSAPHATATPEARAQAWRDWCDAPRRQFPPLSDEAISRENIYFGECD